MLVRHRPIAALVGSSCLAALAPLVLGACVAKVAGATDSPGSNSDEDAAASPDVNVVVTTAPDAGSNVSVTDANPAVVVVAPVPTAGHAATAPGTTTLPPDGGLCAPIASSTGPACDAGLCGNGTIDSCTIVSQGYNCGVGIDYPPGYDGGGIGYPNCTTSRTVSEDCDGVDLGGASCAALGFASGTLGCSASCTYDTRACVTCATGSRIVQCGSEVDCAPVQSFSLAGVGSSLALATVSGAPSPGTVKVSLLSAALAVTATTVVTGITDGVRVALAATPSGWVVAVERSSGALEVVPLAADGSASGPSTVVPGASIPVMAARGDASSVNGGPLLVWSQTPNYARFAVLLASDGTFETAPVAVSTGGVVEPQFSSGVFTGKDFLYGERTDGVTISHIGLDGSLLGQSRPANSATEYPQLAWLGDHAALTFADFSSTGTLEFATLSPSGAVMGAPITLGSIPTNEYNRSPLVPVAGGDVAVLLGGYTGGTDHASTLEVTTLTGTGGSVVPAFAVDNDPYAATAWRAIPFAGDMVAGWIGQTHSDTLLDSGPLYLARVHVAP